MLNVNHFIGCGSAAIDLHTAPEAAIARIKSLRDGAAVQYGSETIASVVKIILKSNASGGTGELYGGITEERGR